MLGLGLGIAYGQLRPLSRYSIDGKAPAVIADYSAGVYGLDGAHVAFGYLLTFTGPAGRTYTNADGDLVTVGLNEPRLGNHIDTGSGLFDTGLLMESEERTNLYPNTHTLNPSSTPSGGTGASPVYNIYPQNSVQTLPDGATGADDGVGFTCTGIASDGDGGFWVGNLGRPSQSSVDPAEPQLVRVNSDASAIMSAIPTSFQMQGSPRETMFCTTCGKQRASTISIRTGQGRLWRLLLPGQTVSPMIKQGTGSGCQLVLSSA